MWCLRTTHIYGKERKCWCDICICRFCALLSKKGLQHNMIHIFILLYWCLYIQQDYWFLFLSHKNILITFFFGYDIYFSEWRRQHILCLCNFIARFFASRAFIHFSQMCLHTKKTMFFLLYSRIWQKKNTWMTHCFIFHSRISDMCATNDLRCGLD